MRIIRAIAELRLALDQARRAGQPIGLVPTMGWFHDGHLSLMRRARAETAVVVASLFVNPTQFNEPADLAAYPRDEERDADMARGERVDVLFAPSAAEMYPEGFGTTVVVANITERLEGAIRGASHFHGVATVVTKLFNVVQPTVAYFGQKDAQQAAVIRRMTRDLDLPIRIEICPTVREADGLAMSSRNIRLGVGDRCHALTLRGGLDAARAAISAGARDPAAIEAAGRSAMRALGVEPEYFAVTAAETLEPMAVATGEVLIVVAARVGDVRLIDNEFVRIP